LHLQAAAGYTALAICVAMSCPGAYALNSINY
jgi:hypothetical protein